MGFLISGWISWCPLDPWMLSSHHYKSLFFLDFLMCGCLLRDIMSLCFLECWWYFILSLVWECTSFLLDKKKVQKKNQDYVVTCGMYLQTFTILMLFSSLLIYFLICGCYLRTISSLCSLECWRDFILSLVWECTSFLLDKKKVQKKNQDYVV